MRYIIIGYQSEPEFWTLRPINSNYGGQILVDLVVGSELDEEIQAAVGDLDKANIHEYFKWCRSLVGKTVEIKELTALTAIGNGIKLISEKEVRS